MKKLKVGDRVEAIGKVDGVNLKGRQGVVKKIDHTDILPVLVESDDKPFAYSRWWGRHEDFKVVKREARNEETQGRR